MIHISLMPYKLYNNSITKVKDDELLINSGVISTCQII
jgi:hypothetical protein